MKYEITKGSEKDFECQPDAVVAIYCINGSPNYLYSSMPSSEKLHENWQTCNFEVIAERRTITEPVWDGEGLPPVGVECEWLDNRETYVPVKIMYSSKDAVVIRGRSQAFNEDVDIPLDPVFEPARCKFRPIRSPEDVARGEGKEVIAKSLRSSKDYDEAAGVIYDAIAAGRIKGLIKEPSTADLKINITTDEMWREFEKKSDMEDVYKLVKEMAYRRGSF